MVLVSNQSNVLFQQQIRKTEVVIFSSGIFKGVRRQLYNFSIDANCFQT